MYYVTGEILLKNEGSVSYQKLSPMQKQVVGIIDEYNDKTLHRLFSKKKTVKEFQDTIDKETIKDHIRPYIEKRLYTILQIASESGFKIFRKENVTQSIFSDDFLTIHRKPATATFKFEKSEEDTQYNLSISCEDVRIELNCDRTEVVSNKPLLPGRWIK